MLVFIVSLVRTEAVFVVFCLGALFSFRLGRRSLRWRSCSFVCALISRRVGFRGMEHGQGRDMETKARIDCFWHDGNEVSRAEENPSRTDITAPVNRFQGLRPSFPVLILLSVFYSRFVSFVFSMLLSLVILKEFTVLFLPQILCVVLTQ